MALCFLRQTINFLQEVFSGLRLCKVPERNWTYSFTIPTRKKECDTKTITAGKMEFEAQIAYSATSELDLPVPAQGSMLVWILVQWAIIVQSSKLPFLQPKAEFDRLIGDWCQTSYKVHTQQQANGRLQ